MKRPSGRYAIVYRAGGRQVWETLGKNRGDADEVLRRRLHALDLGTWVDPRERKRPTPATPSSKTLAEYAEAWLERQDPARTPASTDGRVPRRRIAPATFATYRGDLRRHVLPVLGAKRLDELTGEDVDDLIVALERAGKAPETIRNVVIPLRKLLGEAQRQGLVAANAASRCDLPPAQDFVGSNIPPAHTRAIRDALVELAPPDPLRDGEPDLFWAYAYDVALGTALRFGELRALLWRGVDREQRLIRVERAYSGRELTRPKSEAGIRTVPMFDSVAAALLELAARAFVRRRYADDELVLATERGTPVHPSNFYRRVWAPALELADVAELGYRWHDLRHTCVSRLVESRKFDDKTIMAFAGHADPRLTFKRYTHLRDERVTEAAARFDPAAVD